MAEMIDRFRKYSPRVTEELQVSRDGVVRNVTRQIRIPDSDDIDAFSTIGREFEEQVSRANLPMIVPIASYDKDDHTLSFQAKDGSGGRVNTLSRSEAEDCIRQVLQFRLELLLIFLMGDGVSVSKRNKASVQRELNLVADRDSDIARDAEKRVRAWLESSYPAAGIEDATKNFLDLVSQFSSGTLVFARVVASLDDRLTFQWSESEHPQSPANDILAQRRERKGQSSNVLQLNTQAVSTTHSYHFQAKLPPRYFLGNLEYSEKVDGVESTIDERHLRKSQAPSVDPEIHIHRYVDKKKANTSEVDRAHAASIVISFMETPSVSLNYALGGYALLLPILAIFIYYGIGWFFDVSGLPLGFFASPSVPGGLLMGVTGACIAYTATRLSRPRMFMIPRSANVAFWLISTTSVLISGYLLFAVQPERDANGVVTSYRLQIESVQHHFAFWSLVCLIVVCAVNIGICARRRHQALEMISASADRLRKAGRHPSE